MARRKHGSVPALRLHKPSGKAVVTLSGQDFYCGAWASGSHWQNMIAESLSASRAAVAHLPLVANKPTGLTVVELASFKRHVESLRLSRLWPLIRADVDDLEH